MPVSFDRAWNAAIDAFANQNIPIRTLEPKSGFIATDAFTVSSPRAVEWANCGNSGSRQWAPTRAVYNVRVRGDSSSSTVLVTVRWTLVGSNPISDESYDIECQTRGVWEAEFEALIKRLSESQP